MPLKPFDKNADTLFLFQDLATDLYMKRLVRDYLHYDEKVFCVAARIIRRLDEEAAVEGDEIGWSSLHVRHGEVSTSIVQSQSSNLSLPWHPFPFLLVRQ